MYEEVSGTDSLVHEAIAIVYTIAWASQSAIQAYTNCRLKNMEGYSFNFYILAFCGSVFYTSYCCIGFFTLIQGAGTVVLGDLVYALFNMVMILVQMGQFYTYPRGKNRVSGKAVIICVALWMFVMTNIFLIQVFGVISRSKYWNALSILGYGKLFVSLIKNIPAIYWNYQRKSTKGWPTLKVVLDIIGGSLSLLSGSVSVQNGLNVTKLLLAILTLLFDFIFMFQRYILYPNNKNFLPVCSAHENNQHRKVLETHNFDNQQNQ